MENIITQIADRVGQNFYYPEQIKDFLCDIGFQSEDLKGYTENDFWNDKDKDGRYWCDIAMEWADGMVDIYYADLWRNAKEFQEWTERYMDEFPIEPGTILEELFQKGEFLYWEEFAMEVLNALRSLVK